MRLTKEKYVPLELNEEQMDGYQKLSQYEDIDESPELLAKIKQALEIIKTKVIDVQDIYQYKTFASFNQRRSLRGLLPISKEEYDLLREVLL